MSAVLAPPPPTPASAAPRAVERLGAERGAPALVVLEEAVHLLRFAPVRVRTFYLTGTVPFLLGFLYFWADATRNVNAEQHLVEAALGLAGLFVWMKCWQSAAASELHLHCAGASLPPWTWPRVRRLIQVQLLLQPLKLLVLPLAALVTLPFAAACAYFHAVAIYGDGQLTVAEVRRRALEAAKPWPGQNFLGLTWIALGGIVIFVNLYILGVLLPMLLSIFTGVETDASQSLGAYVGNSTFFAATLAAAHLFLFALTGAFYIVRCFRAQSRHDGRDLLRALELARAARGLAQKTIAVLLFCACALPAPTLLAAVSAPPAGGPVAAREAQLDRKLQEVFERREFAWRLPRAGREIDRKKEESALERFFGRISKWIGNLFRTVQDWWRAIREWMQRKSQDNSRDSSPSSWSGLGGAGAAQPLLYALTALIVLLGLWIGWRQWRRRQLKSVVQAVTAAPAATPAADLADENVLASQLPEDDWLRLAGELESQGEYRLALRALFLSGLAGLAGRGALQIARHKSNRDYQREIERRGRNRAEWTPAFAAAVRLFERSWYGEHPATPETLAEFRPLLDILRREPAAAPAPPRLVPTMPPVPA
ncbi:MAG: DUF4129 domain-containing protein [Verrucomicrobia bacterium]|nr:DUF4129 domain-containing protein [Verrucomicrobiota bacterium]